MVIPAELKDVLVSWQRWALGLEGLPFNQVALGVQRRVPGRGFEGKFGLGAAVMGQVAGCTRCRSLLSLGVALREFCRALASELSWAR